MKQELHHQQLPFHVAHFVPGYPFVRKKKKQKQNSLTNK